MTQSLDAIKSPQLCLIDCGSNSCHLTHLFLMHSLILTFIHLFIFSTNIIYLRTQQGTISKDYKEECISFTYFKIV